MRFECFWYGMSGSILDRNDRATIALYCMFNVHTFM